MQTLRAVAAVAILLAGACEAEAQDTRTQTVKFPRGASGITIKDTISGRESVRYSVGASAGQRMDVQLDTSNASNYFDITAPGASEALFNSSTSGNSASVTLQSSGNYVVDVYLMRNAARRNESAHYSLIIQVEGKAAPAPSRTSPGQDLADGLSGGPDEWRVAGVASGGLLDVRAAASASAPVVERLDNGVRVKNLGCKMTDGQKWCRVETADSILGWVSGRFLRE